MAKAKKSASTNPTTQEQQPMSSSYQETCTEISVSGNVLSATCQRRDGSLNQSSIVLKGIENIDGQLTITDPNKPSNFQGSCTDISINGDVLSATCNKADGSPNQTSIVLKGIENIDGNLTYTGGSIVEQPSQPTAASPNVAPSPAGATQPSPATQSQSKEAESGLEFDGRTTCVEIPHNSRLDLLNNFTIAAWVKPKRFSPGQRILSKAVAYGFGLTGDQIRFTTYGKQDYDTTQAKLSIDTWVHLAVHVDADNQAHFYANGTLVETVAGTEAANQSSAACVIGSQGSGSEKFSGQIAEVRIWQGSRQAEIEATRSHRLQGNEPGLMGYWLLNEGEGTIVHDKTSAANHGTIQGTGNWVTSDLAIAPVASGQPIPVEQAAIPSQPATASPNVAPSPAPVTSEQFRPIEASGGLVNPASAPPNVASPPTSPAEAPSPLVTPTPAVAQPIPPVKLQGRQKVLVFDATQPTISVGSGALRPQGHFTIEAWVHPATDAGKQIILADGETLFYLEGGEVKFQTPLSSQAIASSGAGIIAGSWYHVAVTRVGSLPGATKLYINGVQNDNQAAISPVLAFGDTYLGGQPDVAETRFQGKLLEVRMWRFARSQSEIEADRPYPATGRELGLVRYWSLNQTVSTTLLDKTTYRAVGTLSGNAVWEEVDIPLKLKLDPQERLTRSTGLVDYGYWYREMAKQQKTEADPPFQRGRIWA